MALAASGLGASRKSAGVYGEFRRACAVYAAICAVSGLAITEINPSSVCPMRTNFVAVPTARVVAVSGSVLGAFATAAAGSTELACERNPFPLATNSVWLSGLTQTAVGYQPTGMNPFTTDRLSLNFRT